MPDEKTITVTDPESGESDDITFPTNVNGWVYNSDSPSWRGPIVWEHPEEEDIYVAWQKPGGHTWSASLSTPDDTGGPAIYRTFGDPKSAVQEAINIMEKNDPNNLV